MSEIKEKIVSRFKEMAETREGMNELLNYMEENGYFESPASTKFHNSFSGGLAKHSYGNYVLFKKFLDIIARRNGGTELISDDSAFFISIVHDLCKMGLYLGTVAPYRYNTNNGKGHAKLSVERVEKFIQLTPQEKTIILFHMGPYGTHEFGVGKSYGDFEYSINEMVDAYNNEKLAKLFYFCDDINTQFFEK